MTEPCVRYEKRDGVAILTLSRPQVHNALNEALRLELATALDHATQDPEVAVVVLTGAGERAFSAGMDMKEFSSQVTELSVSDLRVLREARWRPLIDFGKPLIAAINGLAIGGGLELALLCDILVAADTATFAFAEVKRGIIPGNGGTQRLTRRVGKGRALEMVLTGRLHDAQQALQMGLVDHVLPLAGLMDKALWIAQEIQANAPLAVRLAREAIHRGAEMPLADALRLESDLLGFLFTTEDAREGPAAFLEKRVPRWSAR